MNPYSCMLNAYQPEVVATTTTTLSSSSIQTLCILIKTSVRARSMSSYYYPAVTCIKLTTHTSLYPLCTRGVRSSGIRVVARTPRNYALSHLLGLGTSH